MLTLNVTTQFDKDVKRILKRGLPLEKLEAVVDALLQEIPLDQRFRDHPLSGNYAGFRECHIAPDWLLIYKVSKQQLILTAVRTGTHADLFSK